MRRWWIPSLPLLFAANTLLAAEPPAFMEPGSLRFSHDLSLEGVFNKLKPGWQVTEDGRNKVYSVEGDDERPWKSEWGARLKTEVAARVGEDIYARTLFDIEGDYADRLWRPINIEHEAENENEHLIWRQAEASIKKENWYLNGFAGVGHADWYAQGDFFRLYPESYPDSSYLGSSGFFGVYPSRWNEDQYLNMSRRNIPRGGEAGLQWRGTSAAVAYGNELAWGYDESVYGRFTAPIKTTKLTLAAKSEDIPEDDLFNDEITRDAFALSWDVPFEAGHRVTAGVLYQPYRDGERYQIVRTVAAGSGVQGSGYALSEKTSQKEDGLGARLRFEYQPVLWNHLFLTSLDVERLDILAGNKEEVEVMLGTNFMSYFRFDTQYTYRRPVEDAIPFLFEGTPDNIGNVVASPRGPESPFTVNWSNREAVFLLTSLWFDPTTDTNMFLYDPHRLEGWNIDTRENAPMALALQHRMSDYRSTTDRQTYFDENGSLQWEPAAHSGAWPSDGFLHEFRVLGRGKASSFLWTLGVAGGQAPAISGLAYSNDPSQEKPISEYISVEGRIDYSRLGIWGHYGSGVWGPEVNIHPFFGLAFDRVFGLGLSYNVTTNTSVDVGYLGVRQDDDMFVAPDLGSYDEIRTVFSHRFGFQLQFQEF